MKTKRVKLTFKLVLLFAFCFLVKLSKAQVTNNAFGDNMAVVDNINGQPVFAIFTGDLNQDGYIDVFDYPIFEQASFDQISGYDVSDMNGDGYVDVFDYPLFENNSFYQVGIQRPY